jgi:ABC-type nitrate/sulfonate/bicarbonate transport system ATPase subunit
MSSAQEQPKLEVRGVTHVFDGASGAQTVALENINLRFAQGEFVCILGPSGCGKTTLFNIIAGLQLPSDGQVLVDGVDVTGQSGVLGYQLQKDLLLPWRTVVDNVILGLEIHGMPKKDARLKVLPLIKRYGLGGFENHYPGQLSGGMRQRVALLRTLLYDRDIVLFDEPFAALDAQTRTKMQEWLLTTWSEFRKTILFVTHDIEEAVFLSDSIHVLSRRPGRVTARIAVDLPRPRNHRMTLTDEFLAIRRDVAARIDALTEDALEMAK